MAGRNYEFQLTLTNPLYDPIEVKLSVPRIHVSTESPAVEKEDPKAKAKGPTRSPFAVSLPTQKFTISAFAEAWEYDDDEDMFGVEDDEHRLDFVHTHTVVGTSTSYISTSKSSRSLQVYFRASHWVEDISGRLLSMQKSSF